MTVAWFHGEVIKFPEDRKSMGRYLGPTRDNGTGMTAKVLMNDTELKEVMEAYDESVYPALGVTIMDDDYAGGITPE